MLTFVHNEEKLRNMKDLLINERVYYVGWIHGAVQPTKNPYPQFPRSNWVAKDHYNKIYCFFLVGIFFFQFIIGQYIVNQLKSKQNKFWVIISLEINSNQVLKMIKYSKCPFI